MTPGKRILIVDDDEPFRQTLSKQVELHVELIPVEAATGADALETAKSGYFDVIILDVGLPDMDGREVCRLMRKKGVTSPIIMLTGSDTEADTILGLPQGLHGLQPFLAAQGLHGLQAASSMISWDVADFAIASGRTLMALMPVKAAIPIAVTVFFNIILIS